MKKIMKVQNLTAIKKIAFVIAFSFLFVFKK